MPKFIHFSKLYYFFCTIPAFFTLYCIYKYGVNILFWDDFVIWDWDGFVSSENFSLFNFFSFHNDHLIFFPRLIYYLIAKISNVNIKCNLYFIFILYTLVLLIFYNFINNINKPFIEKIFVFFIVNCLLFSIVQYENFLWGFQITFACTFAFSIFSFYFFYLFFDFFWFNYFFCVIFL